MQYHMNGFVAGDPDIQPEDQNRARQSADVPEKVDVLIAGCGPAGLCLAAQMAAYPEISTMIVEPKSGPMEKGQADGVNVRSMEMFQAFGFADKAKRESHWVNETTFWQPNPDSPSEITRVGSVQDVADDLSEMPHVLLNQGRIHDMFLDLMKNSPSRLEPNYETRVLDLTVDNDVDDYPISVVLEDVKTSTKTTVKANYVIGCDGARSNVRKAIGGALHGDAAHQAWGVMDVLTTTDFPDIRMKAVIQSQDQGNILILPREGGYLVRFYVELDKLDETERVADRGLTIDDIITKANVILNPYSIDVKEVVWWSIYEIGHRLTDRFDDVPEGADPTQFPRVFTAGDACHTHSPKAGQGMNVSMGDTFNLGWKLASVLTGRAKQDLLHSYSKERWGAAKGLIDYDHHWSRVMSNAPETEEDSTPLVQRKFVEGGVFTAGLTVEYDPSDIVGSKDNQALATGLEVGKRFHSAPVIRAADAKPMQLGHVAKAGVTWYAYVFAGQSGVDQNLEGLCTYLESDPASPIVKFRKEGDDIDALLDVRAIFQCGFKDLDLTELPSLLRPAKGRYGLHDYEKVFCVDQKSGQNIYDMRGIDQKEGCVVLVRPDQYIAAVLPLTARSAIAEPFENICL